MSTPNRSGARIAGIGLLGVAAIATVMGVVEFVHGGQKTSASEPLPATVAPASELAPPAVIPFPPPASVSPAPVSPAPGIPDGGGPVIAGPPVSGLDAPASGQSPGDKNSRGEVRVYNNSTIRGLAARAARDLTAAGWTVLEVGNYSAGQIPASTAYYLDGTDQRTEAEAIAAQFGMRVAPRFPGIAKDASGLIVIVTNNYRS
ncbi:MAG TPA: LytR C-terminal domain-containing protein [Pseudonocardiaceae bacterium]